MKKIYLKPATTTETLSLTQIIAESPALGDTPQINDNLNDGSDALTKEETWGNMW